MPVTKYLERAREAAALADTLTGDAQAKVLDIAETWRKIAVIEADEIAKEEAKKRSPTSQHRRVAGRDTANWKRR
jgi:hypothetical protein